MPLRNLICAAALLFVAAAPRPPAVPSSGTGFATTSPDTITRYYSLTVRFRPFLLWMTRDDVGGARVSWSASAGPDAWVELLVGSDPERAPMAINRWGFIAEQRQGDTTHVTGLMTETDDESIDGARSNAAAIANGRAFRTIRSTVRDGDATTSIGRLIAGTDVTYREYAALLDRLPAAPAGQHLRLASGIEPGFLTAVKALITDSVARCQRAPQASPARLSRDYVYAGTVYRLSQQSANLLSDVQVDGRSRGRAIEGTFQIRNRTTGTTTDFRLTYPVSGPDAETPLRVVYRPRWWLELELTLVSRDNPTRSVLAMTQLAPPRNPNVPR